MLQVMLWRTYSISIYHFIGTKRVFLQGWRGCCQCFDACLWVKASPPVIHRCVWMSNLCSKHLPSVSALEDCRLFGDSDKTPVGTGTGRVWGMQPQFGKCCLPTCWRWSRELPEGLHVLREVSHLMTEHGPKLFLMNMQNTACTAHVSLLTHCYSHAKVHSVIYSTSHRILVFSTAALKTNKCDVQRIFTNYPSEDQTKGTFFLDCCLQFLDC